MKHLDLTRNAVLGLTLLGAPMLLAACDDGPAEEAGEAIDDAREEAAEEMADDLEDRADQLEERAEELE